MFLSKFSVVRASTRCVLQNLMKSSECLYSSATDKGKLCPNAHVPSSVCAESRCEKYKESLEKCSKTQPKSACNSGGAAASRTQDACGVRHAAEAFSRALAKVRNDALTLQIYTRNSVNAIAASLDLENANRLKTERSQAIKRLQTVVDKVDEITRMSFSCGDAKRNELYAIHEQIFASLQVWECENASGEHSVKRRLEELECTVKERTDTAVAIVRTCKGCVNPVSLRTCVEASESDAECILKMTDEHAKNEIASIEKLKNQVLQENGSIMQQLMSEFEQAVLEFEKQLNTLIGELKKSKKR